MDIYQIIATGGMVLGGIVTIVKAWTGLNNRQQEHARIIKDLSENVSNIKSDCVMKHNNIEEYIRTSGALFARLETLLDERTERRIAP